MSVKCKRTSALRRPFRRPRPPTHSARPTAPTPALPWAAFLLLFRRRRRRRSGKREQIGVSSLRLSFPVVSAHAAAVGEGRTKEQGGHSGTKVLSTSGKGGHCATKRGSTSEKKMEPAAAAVVNPPRDGESGISGALKSLGRLTHHHPKVPQVAGSLNFGPVI